MNIADTEIASRNARGRFTDALWANYSLIALVSVESATAPYGAV